jgi:flagellar basal-body rod protein FlgC
VFSTDRQASPFSSVFQAEVGQGVRVADIVVDDRPPEMRYMPGHPDADGNGYVAFPHMNPAEEMVDLLNASRSYQSNVAAMSAVKDMLNRSIELMR